MDISFQAFDASINMSILDLCVGEYAFDYIVKPSINIRDPQSVSEEKTRGVVRSATNEITSSSIEAQAKSKSIS